MSLVAETRKIKPPMSAARSYFATLLDSFIPGEELVGYTMCKQAVVWFKKNTERIVAMPCLAGTNYDVIYYRSLDDCVQVWVMQGEWRWKAGP